MIGNSIIDQLPPQWQHIENQGDDYLPDLPRELRATVWKSAAQTLVRTAYFTNPVETQPRDATRLTGMYIPEPMIARGVPESRDRFARSHFRLGSVGGLLGAGVVLNVADMTDGDVVNGQMHASFGINFWDSRGLPEAFGFWAEVSSHPPYYSGWRGNAGGEGPALIIKWVRLGSGEGINLVIRLYAPHPGQWIDHEAPVAIEKNNKGLHVKAHVGARTRYTDAHPRSAHTQYSRGRSRIFSPCGDTFRVHVGSANFYNLLIDSENFLKRPLGAIKEWRLNAVIVNYELNPTGGAILAGGHAGPRVWAG